MTHLHYSSNFFFFKIIFSVCNVYILHGITFMQIKLIIIITAIPYLFPFMVLWCYGRTSSLRSEENEWKLQHRMSHIFVITCLNYKTYLFISMRLPPLRDVHYLHYASLTVCSLSILVTSQCNPNSV